MSAADQDEVMAEAPAVEEIDIDTDNFMPVDPDRITLLPGAIETAASFQFEAEGHTLGNALRYVLMKNPKVEFCGYTIPHPSEPKMNLRIQTHNTTNVFETLDKGLTDLMDLCDVVTDKFTSARDDFDLNSVR